MRFRNFDDVMDALEIMEKNAFVLEGEWDAHQHLVHCAQAIGYSVTGYPELKPALMQKTIGKLAFHMFSWQGRMFHNTNHLTPGSPDIPKNGLMEGITLLRSQMVMFDDWKGPMHPHEFYGRLSRKQHMQAHTMHFENHFRNFKF